MNQPKTTGAGPLSGITVIDWTHVLAGPFVGYQLALLGANVIRIERPDGDDMIRAKAADQELASLGLGEAFVVQGAGKRSVAIDVRDPRAKRAMEALISRADVLIENFRPGKLAKLGFDPAELIARHPKLIVCSVTGFGQGSDKRAYDHVVQAASGLMAANAGPDGRPQRIGFPIVDYAVGQQAALAVMAALFRRSGQTQRTQGEWIQVSMMGAALTLMAPAFAAPLVSGIEPKRSSATAFSGNPLSGTFATQHGYLAIVCNAAIQGDALIKTLADSVATIDEVRRLQRASSACDVNGTQAILGELLSRRSALDWVTLLEAAGVPAASVVNPVDAARNTLIDWPVVELALVSGNRQTHVPGIGYQSTEILTGTLRPPARRGEHTAEVLAEVGLGQVTIDKMVAEGVAFSCTPAQKCGG